MPVFDIETDGLNATKIHVLSWMGDDGNVHHTHDYVAMRIFFEEADILIGHNIIRFDIPQVEKVLGVKIKAKLVDTSLVVVPELQPWVTWPRGLWC